MLLRRKQLAGQRARGIAFRLGPSLAQENHLERVSRELGCTGVGLDAHSKQKFSHSLHPSLLGWC